MSPVQPGAAGMAPVAAPRPCGIPPGAGEVTPGATSKGTALGHQKRYPKVGFCYSEPVPSSRAHRGGQGPCSLLHPREEAAPAPVLGFPVAAGLVSASRVLRSRAHTLCPGGGHAGDRKCPLAATGPQSVRGHPLTHLQEWPRRP